MSIYIAARGAGRSGFPVYPRTVSIYSNNYRKLHGMSMMRHVHLRKIEKKRIDKMIEEYLYNLFFPVGMSGEEKDDKC